MRNLNLPDFKAVVRTKDGKDEIFDPIRKKYVRLSPEEWVRQAFVAYLILTKNYPAGLMAIEKEIVFNKQKRRPDIVVFKNDLRPLLAVECKAPEVKITQEAFDQLIRYNSVIQVKYLLVTNGLQHFCCEMDYTGDSYRYLREVPDFMAT
ncbi:MAG: type I restriction enzyme HsdR N-terminal domain-containing protein [Bacteroidota bacterium]|nr:type I restriction enzyme HsdR N-terminal domain-containing protein [Bacteroidota bacterium]